MARKTQNLGTKFAESALNPSLRGLLKKPEAIQIKSSLREVALWATSWQSMDCFVSRFALPRNDKKFHTKSTICLCKIS
ncbi:hypothetical protein [Helicobacter sp. 23-1045]